MKKFETSLTNFLLILVLIFFGVGIKLLSTISNQLGHIYINVDKMTSNTYATVLELERDRVNKAWTKEEWKSVDTYYENLWEISTGKK